MRCLYDLQNDCFWVGNAVLYFEQFSQKMALKILKIACKTPFAFSHFHLWMNDQNIYTKFYTFCWRILIGNIIFFSLSVAILEILDKAYFINIYTFICLFWKLKFNWVCVCVCVRRFVLRFLRLNKICNAYLIFRHLLSFLIFFYPSLCPPWNLCCWNKNDSSTVHIII